MATGGGGGAHHQKLHSLEAAAVHQRQPEKGGLAGHQEPQPAWKPTFPAKTPNQQLKGRQTTQFSENRLRMSGCVHHWKRIGQRPIRRDVSLHRDFDRQEIRLQVDFEAEACHQERQGGHQEGDSDYAAFERATQHCGVRRLLRGQAVCPCLYGAGELFDRIIAKGHYSERAASSICRAIVNVVHICHFMGVMHRDLKPENFLLSSKDENALLKPTDFGLSVFIEEGKLYRDIVGSAYYVAPEVMRCRYGKEIDIWSTGVILYILLSGVPPFWAETEKGMFDAILEGEIDFSSAPWPSISTSAKDLVRRMLTQDPKKRITSTQVREHPWIRDGGEASDKPIDSAVLSRMKQFREMNKPKKLALKVIAEILSEEEIHGLKAMFRNMDTDNSGTITYDELKSGLARLGSKLTEAEVKQLMEAVIYYQNCCFFHYDECLTLLGLQDGRINYEEFSTMMRSGMQPQAKLF